MDRIVKSIIKYFWIFIKYVTKLFGLPTVAIVLVCILALGFIIDSLNLMAELDLFAFDWFQKEAQVEDMAHKMLYDRVSKIGMHQKVVDYTSFEQILNEIDETTRKIINDTSSMNHDANLNTNTGFKSAAALNAYGDFSKFFRDFEGKEEQYGLSKEMLAVLNNETLYNFSGTSKIMYPEQFIKPLNQIEDYNREDKDGKPFTYTYEWDESTGKLKPQDLSGTKIYDYVAVYNNNLHVRATGKKDLIKEFEMDTDTKINDFDNEYTSMKKVYYQVDSKGNPIPRTVDEEGNPVSVDEQLPRKYLQLIQIMNKDGKVIAKSLNKYNSNEKKVKKALMADYDELQIERLINEYFDENKDVFHDQTSKQSIIAEIRRNYEEKKLLGEESVDWEWVYQGEWKPFGEMQSDVNFIYTAKEEDFRYQYVAPNRWIDKALKDKKYEYKNTEYAWSDKAKRAVYKETGRIVPMVIDSVADYGLAPAFTYNRGMSMDYMKALGFKETRDTELIKQYFIEKYGRADVFPDAVNGAYPEFFETNDENFKKYVTNWTERLYIDDMMSKFNSGSMSISSPNVEVGANKNSSGVANAKRFDAHYDKYGKMYGVDSALLRAQATQESGGNENDTSGAGWGLMQIEDTNYGKGGSWDRPVTATTIDGQKKTVHMKITRKSGIFFRDERLDPEKAIEWAAAHMSELIKRYNGDQMKALLAYNMGAGAVDKLLKNYPNDWMEKTYMIPALLGKSEHGDPAYISHVMRYYDGTTLSNVNIPTVSNFGYAVPSQNPLINEKTIDGDGKFIGIDGYEDKNINSKLEVITPYATPKGLSILEDTDLRDQILHPEKYYYLYASQLEKDQKKSEMIWGSLANLAGYDMVTKDTGVNGEVDFSKLGHNKNLEAKKNEIVARGEVNLVKSYEKIFMIEQALTFAGRFFYGYEEGERIARGFSENEEKAVYDLYEANRYQLLKNWKVELEITKTKYKQKSSSTKNLDGSTSISYTWEQYEVEETKDITSQAQGDIHPNLEIYRLDPVQTEYDENYNGQKLFDTCFKRGNYEDLQELRVPRVSDSVIDSFNYEKGEPETSSYEKSEVKSLKFVLDVEDKVNEGTIHELWKYYYGSIMQVRPFVNEVYFNNERLTDWKVRMTTTEGLSFTQEQNIHTEMEETLGYIRDYLLNFEAFVPNHVIKDYKAFTRTKDYYYVPNQNIDATKKFSPEVEGYRNVFLQVVSEAAWIPVYDILGLNRERDKNKMAEILMGIVEEERKSDNPNCSGFANIYVPDGVTELHSKKYWDDIKSLDFSISVSDEQDDREDPYLSIQYIGMVMRNLIMKYGYGLTKSLESFELAKAITAYHFTIYNFDDYTPDTLDKLIEDGFTDTWAQREKSEIINVMKLLGREVNDINPQIAQDVLSYLSAGQGELADNSEWWEEWYKKMKLITQKTVYTADNLFDKMFGDLYNSWNNRGIMLVRNHQDTLKVNWIITRIESMRKKIPIEDITRDSWTLWDFFGTSYYGINGNTAGMIMGDSQSTAQNLAFFKENNMIYNIESYSSPYSDPNPRFSSPFGWRKLSDDIVPRIHTGVDVSKPEGEPILSIAGGEVVFAGWLGTAGYTVMVKHPIDPNLPNDYILSVYMHMVTMPEVRVRADRELNKIERGQILGKTGNTGHSFGNHLHFEIRAFITKENPKYDLWKSIIVDYKGNPYINPFWFATAKPDQLTIDYFSKFRTIEDLKRQGRI